MSQVEEIPILVKKTISKIDQEAKVILFGSRARGDFGIESDWDFLIITTNEINAGIEDEIRTQLYHLELETDQVISSIIESKSKWEDYSNSELYNNIKMEGIEVNLSKAA